MQQSKPKKRKDGHVETVDQNEVEATVNWTETTLIDEENDYPSMTPELEAAKSLLTKMPITPKLSSESNIDMSLHISDTCNQMVTENTRIMQQTIDIKMKDTLHGFLAAKMAPLEQKIRMLENELASQAKEMDLLQNENDNMAMKLKQLEAEYGTAKSAKCSLTDEINGCSEHLKCAEKEKINLNGALNDAKSNLENLKRQNETLIQQINQMNGEWVSRTRNSQWCYKCKKPCGIFYCSEKCDESG